jgi:hypothetical protein
VRLPKAPNNGSSGGFEMPSNQFLAATPAACWIDCLVIETIND